ncbi:hypothetical protein Q3G72_024697 [Acer saccharum]|nr:hypothetical protein Q3G72_021148 [Acer saccharum]KAK1588574.1 hypothetical protein Q3G72_024697 [Acer saccharum]
MKEATEANISDAVSSKIEKPDAGSKSYNNKGETTASSSSDNQEIRNFELMDSLYSAAADGDKNSSKVRKPSRSSHNSFVEAAIVANIRAVSSEIEMTDDDNNNNGTGVSITPVLGRG